MKKLLSLFILGSLPALTHAEVCLTNQTGLPESAFAYEFIKDPVINRSNPAKPLVTSPTQFFYEGMGHLENNCVNLEMSGHLAIFVDLKGQHDSDDFWMTKDPIIDSAVMLTVTKNSAGKIIITKQMAGKKSKVAVEKVYGLPKD